MAVPDPFADSNGHAPYGRIADVLPEPLQPLVFEHAEVEHRTHLAVDAFTDWLCANLAVKMCGETMSVVRSARLALSMTFLLV